MIILKNKQDCCGCNACGDICPRNAISFKTDNEGFLYPSIDSSKCNDCGLCNKICPMLLPESSTKDKSIEPECYAAYHKSIDTVFSSTSGGLFSALAEIAYSKNGYVGGAVHNDDFSVSELLSNNKDDLKRLRRSKDLQSNSIGFYKDVKKCLSEGEFVLVCALPCQIQGLKNYLQKDYPNLITIDLICLGVNSPLVWKKYLEYVESIANSKVVYTENKCKEYGWSNLTQKFIFSNGKEQYDTKKTNLFLQGYVGSHLYCRPSCYECKFKGFPRKGDITIGDYWGIENVCKDYFNDLGTSLVFVNTQKGKEYFELAKKRINCISTTIQQATKNNAAIYKSISKLNNNRAEFFSDLNKLPFDNLIKKYSIRKHPFIRSKLRAIKRTLRCLKLIIKTTRLKPIPLYQTLKYSGIKSLIKSQGIIFSTNCVVNISKSSELKFNGLLVFGKKSLFPSSKVESRLFLGKGASLCVNGDFYIESDCEIVIFNKAQLIIQGSNNSISDANSGLRIICGDKIEIQSDVGIGRNVTIRDTNGKHYLNTVGYRITRPIVIGEKSWLCESCSILPGVKLGNGTIVGINSTVTKSTKPHSLVSGSPATVVQENVLWKL